MDVHRGEISCMRFSQKKIPVDDDRLFPQIISAKGKVS